MQYDIINETNNNIINETNNNIINETDNNINNKSSFCVRSINGIDIIERLI
jgi:hypothetical protein